MTEQVRKQGTEIAGKRTRNITGEDSGDHALGAMKTSMVWQMGNGRV